MRHVCFIVKKTKASGLKSAKFIQPVGTQLGTWPSHNSKPHWSPTAPHSLNLCPSSHSLTHSFLQSANIYWAPSLCCALLSTAGEMVSVLRKLRFRQQNRQETHEGQFDSGALCRPPGHFLIQVPCSSQNTARWRPLSVGREGQSLVISARGQSAAVECCLHSAPHSAPWSRSTHSADCVLKHGTIM